MCGGNLASRMSAGTITMPPPIPNIPASTPAPRPMATNTKLFIPKPTLEQPRRGSDIRKGQQEVGMEQNTGSRATRNDTVVVWVVSVLLAAVFATTGLAKLIGREPIGLQAAAMNGFPQWIRTLVGIVEVGGAAALLVPPVAAVAASMLALLMVPATITQWVSGEPGLFIPVLLFALLMLVAWRRNPTAVRAGYDAAVNTPRPLVREGVIAGIIGATAIAIWFFFVDAIAGESLFTPRTLGYAVLSIFGPVPDQ